MVLSLEADGEGMKHLTAVSEENGLTEITARAVVLAMGCRERNRGALNIPGTRPAGIYTAGAAQKFVNIKGLYAGREGRHPRQRRHRPDYGPPDDPSRGEGAGGGRADALFRPASPGISSSASRISASRSSSPTPSPKSTAPNGSPASPSRRSAPTANPSPGSEQYFDCDTVLLSCGLIPENELTRGAGIPLDPVTGGASVAESRETEMPGVFAAGNVLHVHDLVDFVSDEAEMAGRSAARWLQGKLPAVERTLRVRRRASSATPSPSG